ncbi:MAG: RNA polymerase sigma factor, partial [Bryobacteraceae bacterium]
MLSRFIPVSFKNDNALAKRLRERDPSVMGDLYDRYGRLVYSLVFRTVRNSAAAEDLVQETFLRVWNRAQSFDPERGAPGPWILTVARNRAIDYLRSTDGRLAAGAIDLDQLEHPNRFRDFEDSALSLDRTRRLKHAFDKLTPNQKVVLE